MYKITFSDNTQFFGGSLENLLWKEAPNKPIIKLQCIIFDKTISFKNFESYNLVVEKVNLLNKNNGREKISKLYLMGKYKDRVYVIKINLLRGAFQHYDAEFGKEWDNKLPLTGWKEGLVTEKPSLSTGYPIKDKSWDWLNKSGVSPQP